MTADKKKIATKLVHLTLRKPTITGAGISEQYKEELDTRYFDEQIALRVKHFGLDELQALLDFYSTDIGKSVLECHNNMVDDMGIRLVSSDAEDAS